MENKELGFYECDSLAIISATPTQLRWETHKKAVATSFYTHNISDICYNSAMSGMDTAIFAFYTEPGEDYHYNPEYEKLTVSEVIELLADYGYKASSMRISPTLILINISWKDRAHEARASIEFIEE